MPANNPRPKPLLLLPPTRPPLGEGAQSAGDRRVAKEKRMVKEGSMVGFGRWSVLRSLLRLVRQGLERRRSITNEVVVGVFGRWWF